MEQMECWNTGEKVSPASLVLPLVRRSQSGIVSFTVSPTQSVRHRHSGIDVSPVPLVTEQSGSAQLWEMVHIATMYLVSVLCSFAG
jgi:hypothetical protein